MFKAYLSLTKPGIIRGNLLTALAGFFLAASGTIDWSTLFAMLVGLSFIIASGCVFNNIIDRKIDSKMKRTQKRALVNGAISVRSATIFGTMLGISGTVVLGVWTNALTLLLALFGLFAYVVIYGVGKRKTVYGTLIGSISGSIPPLVGYAAAAHRLDSTSFLLYLVITFWQMPHFYGIAMFRANEYKAAGIPVLPLVYGMSRTRHEILAYIVGFTICSVLLGLAAPLSNIYIVLMIVVGSLWIMRGIRNYKRLNDVQWGKAVFLYSLVAITIFSIAVSVDASF